MYEEDLARVHDAGFTDLAEAAARMVLEEARPLVPSPVRQGAPRPLAVDLGCGSGVLMALLADAGFAVLGSDVSKAMLALARRRLPEARLLQADAFRTPMSGAAVVTAVGEVVNHAWPTRPADWARRVHDALLPGGVFLFDVATTEREEGVEEARREGWSSADGPGGATAWRVEAVTTTRNGVLERAINTRREVDAGERHHREVHRVVLLDPDEVQADLEAAGFQVERLGGYDDHGFERGWDGFLARRAVG